MEISLVLSENNYQYSGSVTNNTEECYNNITWLDIRQKPDWNTILTQWNLLNIKLKKQNCKNEAKQKISNSDWSVLPDVKISNKSEFENYRAILRNYILNPVEDPSWPQEPDPIWQI